MIRKALKYIEVEFLRIGLLVLTLISNLGCQHTLLSYKAEVPFYAVKEQENLESETKNAESTTKGFIWTSCADLNSLTLRNLKNQCLEFKCNAIVGIEWFNEETKNWQSSPICRKEYGWLFGLIYTFWWPEATIVRARAVLVKSNSSDLPIRINPSNQEISEEIGSNEVDKAWLKSNVKAIGFDGVILGGPDMAWFDFGITYTHMIDLKSGWDLNLNLGGVYSGPPPVSNYRNIKLASRYIYHVSDSFYLNIGPAIQQERYNTEDRVALNSKEFDAQDTGYGWTSLTLGGEAATGNRWYFDGYYVGVEWLQIYKPLSVMHFEETKKHDYGEDKGNYNLPSLKLLGLQVGWIF